MRKIYLLIFQLIVVMNVAVAADPQEYYNKVSNSFLEYYKYGIDEKLYIQTDKPYYSAGENIWLKGFLVNAITHRPLDLSNYIYVELTNRKGEIVNHIKIKRDSVSGFNGYFKLKPKMDAGDYSIRAYTKWMTNSNPDFFFEKTIEIVSPIPDDSMAGQAQRDAIEAAKTAKEKREDKKEAKDPDKKLEYDLQFFPEGGALIAGVPQMIAFKALAEDGLSMEVKGYIYNSKNERIAEFATVHQGMGMVQMIVPEGDQFYAKATSSEGLSKQFNLPLATSKEVSLKVSRVGTNIYYQALAADPNLLKGVKAIIHSRGRIITVDAGELQNPRRMPISQVYAGVSVISLVNQAQEVVAERIFFKKPTAMPTVDIRASKPDYDARTKATVVLNLKSSNGQPTQGQLAVSVLDDGAIQQDSTKDSALSYLLLSSEIKGHVENPGLYFSDNSRVMDSKLDMLMMTQGWRRFDLEKVLDPKIDHRRAIQYEDIVSIRGEVKGFFGNSARKPKLSLICQKLHLIDVYDLDENSKFNLMDVNIPDSAVYIIQAQGRNGGKTLTLKVDEEVLPTPHIAQYSRKEKVVPFEFVNQSIEKFYYEGGLTMIELESVVVTAEAVSTVENSEFATRTTGRTELETMAGATLTDLITTYMGIEVTDEDVYYRGSSSPVKFRVNNLDEEWTNLSTLSVDLIQQVDFFDSTASSGLFTDSNGGVFNITLIDGASVPRLRLPNIVNYAPLGYQRIEKFYAPAYDTPSKKSNLPPDYRTTIFWSGDIVPDAAGNARFEFYTADKSTTYRIIVEGVTSQGEICHNELVIGRGEAVAK